MTDQSPGETSDQQSGPQQSEGPQTVEIDPRPRVGLGGGVDSFRNGVDEHEER